MKGKRIILGLIAGGLVAAMSTTTFAAYVSISHNLVNGQGDTTYNPGTQELMISASGANLITLNDPSAIAGTVSNGLVQLTTNFHTVNGSGAAVFNGGSYLLSFDFDADGPGPGPALSYSIGGPIFAMEFTLVAITPTFYQIDGSGLFTASTVNLPGSGIWPDGGGYSTIDSLSLGFNGNIAGWNWDGTFPGSRVETTYSIVPNPNGVPEPASLALLAAGAMTLIRRRR
jgi:hypothetical protein